MKYKFDALGIEIPFPHITLYPGKDKQGDSPALAVELKGRADGAGDKQASPAPHHRAVRE
jgi:hypothetical protein